MRIFRFKGNVVANVFDGGKLILNELENHLKIVGYDEAEFICNIELAQTRNASVIFRAIVDDDEKNSVHIRFRKFDDEEFVRIYVVHQVLGELVDTKYDELV